MKVQAMHDLPRHDIHPAVGHSERFSLEIEFQRARELRHVPIQLALEGRESWRQLMHAAGGVIRREPARIILRGPALPSLVVAAELLALAQEPIVEMLPAGAAESRRVDERGKERVRTHDEHYMKQAPYGTWHSPLAAADLARSAISLNYTEVSEGAPYWVESRPAEGGRSVVVTAAADGAVRELTPTRFNVRTRVHEYGGTPYVMSRDTVYFSNFADQRLYAQRPDETLAHLLRRATVTRISRLRTPVDSCSA